MSEPSVTPGEWLALTVTSMLAGMGGAMGWFKNNNIDRDKRIKKVEDGMKEFTDMQAEHNTQLAVIEACQTNTASTLLELKALHRDMNIKLDRLLEK